MRITLDLIKKHAQPGQALIIIVFAIIGLFGIVALSIDGSHAFSVRRRMQSAADNSAMKAAVLYSSEPNSDPIAEGEAIAATNLTAQTYTINISKLSGIPAGCDGNTVSITLQPTPPSSPEMADSLDFYFLVVIREDVPTYFGPIIGVNETHICVQSIARGAPTRSVPAAYDSAIAAMDCHAKWAIKSSGSSQTIVINGDLFSNSDNQQALLVNKVSNLDLQNSNAGIDVVGGVSLPNPNPYQVNDYSAYQIPCPFPDYMYPDYDNPYTCDFTYDNFPDKSEIEEKDGVVGYYLETGKTYCITGSFKLPNLPMYGQDIHLVLLNEGVHWNGQAELHLTAGIADDDPLKGVLIYVPYPNTSSIVFNGTADSDLTGGIFAPNSDITLNGDYSGSSWDAQIIGATVDLTGGQNLTLDYHAENNPHVPDYGAVELTR